MSKVYVFRIADNAYVRSELKNGRLRQGWGDASSNLQGVSQEEWVRIKCQTDPFEGNLSYYSSKYRNLVKMLEIEKGDILIIPKAPTHSQFTICRAAEPYRFAEPLGYEGNDFYHFIPIDPSSVREFNYHANEKCKIIHAKLRAYQSPLNTVWNESVIEAAETVIGQAGDTAEKSTESVVKDIRDDIYKKAALDRFRNLGNRETEKIVKLVFEKMGYEFIGSNSYDREGGDADLIFADNSLAELMDVGVNSREISGKVFVQIKNKTGKDYGDMQGVKQLIKRSENEPGAVKILISTADSFTDDCIEIANKRNILLIDGIGFLKLVFTYIN